MPILAQNRRIPKRIPDSFCFERIPRLCQDAKIKKKRIRDSDLETLPALSCQKNAKVSYDYRSWLCMLSTDVHVVMAWDDFH